MTVTSTRWSTSSSRLRRRAASVMARSGSSLSSRSYAYEPANAAPKHSEAAPAVTVAPAAPGGYAKERADLLARPGLSGSGRRRALSDLSDTWLAQVFADADGEKTGAALVAVGGYGRRELSPGSDLDL